MISFIQDFWESIWFARRRPVVSGLAPESLELSDDELAWHACRQAGQALNDAKGAYNSKVHLLPPQWRLVYSLLVLDSQVRNGGFHQFFTNSRGAFDSFLESDLSTLDPTGFHPVIVRAFSIYRGVDYSRQWANLGKSWAVFVEGYEAQTFDQLDSLYYKVKPQLDAVLGAHIRSHFSLYKSA